MTARLASFDVFDCVLLRDVLVPTDLFERVGERIVALRGNAAGISAADFAQLRCRAEARARARSAHEEVTLDEIWDELFESLGWPREAGYPQVELSEEERSIAPVAFMRDRIAEARSRHGAVAFISDTYLPRAFVEAQLRRHELLTAGDRLYLSCEARCTKATGKLFEHVLRAEKIAPGELAHWGDNIESDFIVPRRLGIRADRVSVPDLSDNERDLISNPWSGFRTLRDTAGAARQFRLHQRAGAHDPVDARELVGAFLGPFCGRFAAWVLDSARRQGLSRLYFCARDGQLLWRAARILAPQFGGIDCRYLHVSRQALMLPAVEQATREEMQWLRRSFEAPLLDRILAKVELGGSPSIDGLARLGTPSPAGTVIPDDRWDDLWSALEAAPIRGEIERNAAKRREAALAYFREQGLFEVRRVALVDIGWFLTCQASIRKMLRAAGHAGDVHGFYLQLNSARMGPTEAGSADSVFLEPAPDLRHVDERLTLGMSASFLEHVVGLADHPSLNRYELGEDGKARLVFASAPASESEGAARRIARIHAELERYVETYRSTLSRPIADRSTLAVVLGRILASFYRHAGASAVHCLSDVMIGADPNHLDSHRLVEPMSWAEAIRPLFPGRFFRARYIDPRQPWPRAKYVMTPRIRYAANVVASTVGLLRAGLANRVRRAELLRK